MREIEMGRANGILIVGLDELVRCPIVSSVGDPDFCDNRCAWFSKKRFNIDMGSPPDMNSEDEYAYCQENCIGKIKDGK